MLQRIGQLARAHAPAPAPARAPREGTFDAVRGEAPVAPAPAPARGPLAAAATPPRAAGEPGLAERAATAMIDDRRALDRAMARARRGGDLSAQQLLALQLRVHDYAMKVETATRVVGKATEAVRTVMQQQV